MMTKAFMVADSEAFLRDLTPPLEKD